MLDATIASGLAVIDTHSTPDMIVRDVGQVIDIYETKKALDGIENRVPRCLSPYCPMQGVGVVLNAGVRVATAPGAQVISVYSARKEIQGNPKTIRFDCGAALQSTIAAGGSIVEAEVDGAKIKAPATGIADERVEITIP